MRPTRVVAVALSGMLALSACSGSEEVAQSPSPVSPSPSSPSVDAAADELWEPLDMGESATVADLEVVVSDPRRLDDAPEFKDAYEFDAGEVLVSVAVKVTNRGDAPMELPDMLQWEASVDGADGETFNYWEGWGQPSTRLLPGRSVEFRMGWAVMPGKSLVVDVTERDVAEEPDFAVWAAESKR